jgi:hypothetical protein
MKCFDPQALIGNKFKRFIVTEYLGRNEHKRHLYKCLCECGKEKVVTKDNLFNKTGSCGCLKRDLNLKNKGVTIEERCIKGLYSRYVAHAKNKNVPFDLTYEDVKYLIFSNCFYCNSPPKGKFLQKRKYEQRVICYNGIDEANIGQGYTKDNALSCCWTCNDLKSNRDKEDFLNLIRTIYINCLG